MFTGIIEAVGTVGEIRDEEGLRRIEIVVAGTFLHDVAPGDSIAVDGACLTPVEIGPDRFLVDAIRSTLSRTVAGAYEKGRRVNLERARALGERMDGHLVQGHVDGIGHLIQIRDEGETRFIEIRIPEEVARQTILHGSITLNGVSLTVHRLQDPDRVEVGLIPHTRAHTNLEDLSPGDPLNVEGDLIGKYVGRLLRSTPLGSQ